MNRQLRAGRKWRSLDHFLTAAKSDEERTHRANYLKLLAWRASKGSYLEALCLLTVLSRVSVPALRVEVDIFGTVGPLHVGFRGRRLYLWTRAALPKTISGLRAHPDILCTSTPEIAASPDIEWIIECKHRGLLSSQELRAEFGKAFDLESPAYTLVTYEMQSDRVVAAAKQLGLDVIAFPLASERRSEYMRQQRYLEEDLAESIISSRLAATFARSVLSKGERLEGKLLSSTR